MLHDPFLTHPNDHIMANTWRLIFERNARNAPLNTHIDRLTDNTIEELLTEYRLIGLALATPGCPRRYS